MGILAGKRLSSVGDRDGIPGQAIEACANSRRRCGVFLDGVLCVNGRWCNGSENQKRVKEFAEEHGPENLVVLWALRKAKPPVWPLRFVTNGDPTYAGPLTGVQLGLKVYHVCEPKIKAEFDPAVYDEQVSMMEMVLNVDEIVDEMTSIREQFCKY